MINKLFWFIIIIFVLYILMIFKMPVIADKIQTWLGFNWFNEFVIDFKNSMDSFFTRVPTKEELKEWYNSTLSWAVDFKNDVVTWVNDVKDWIDSVRWTLSWAVDTYNDVKETVIDTKETIDSTVETIKDTSESLKDTAEKINSISNSISSTWITN